MLDFNRVEFNKSINLSVNKKVEIESKYPLVAIEKILEKISGNTTKIQKEEILKIGKYPVITQEQEKLISGYTNNENKITDLPLVIFGDHSCTFKYVDFEFIRGADGTQLLKPNKSFNIKYFYNILQIVEIENKDKYERHMKYLNSIKIPLPPLDIQEQIVKECQKVDDEVSKANEIIEQSKQNIENGFLELFSNATHSFKLSNDDIFDVSIGRRVLAKEIEENPSDEAIAVYSANVFEPFGYIKKDLLKDFSKDSVLWGIDGDWMVNFMPKEKPFYPTDHCGVVRIKQDILHGRYLAWALNNAGIEFRFSRANRASTERIKGMVIKAPSFEEQNKFALEVEKLEKNISEAGKVINGAKEKKEEILKKYL